MKREYTYDDYLEETFGDSALNRHKTGDRIKWVLTLIAFILIAVTLAGIIFGWFDNLLNKEETPDEEEQTVAYGALLSNAEGYGIVLASAKIAEPCYAEYGVSALAESAYTLTAKVYPSDADNNKVDWSVSFANPTSAWANGKSVTDYITVAPNSDGALKATVTCKKAFGEQIKVRATSRDDSTYYAECTCDYVKRLESFTFTPSPINFGTTSYTVSTTFGAGTITPTVNVEINKITLNSTLAERVISNFTSEGCTYAYAYNTDWWFFSGYIADNIAVNNNTQTFSKAYSSDFQTWFTYMDDEDYSSDELAELVSCINAAFRRAGTDYTGKQATMSVTYTVTHNGVSYGGSTINVDATFNFAAMKVGVNGVSMDEGSQSLIY